MVPKCTTQFRISTKEFSVFCLSVSNADKCDSQMTYLDDISRDSNFTVRRYRLELLSVTPRVFADTIHNSISKGERREEVHSEKSKRRWMAKRRSPYLLGPDYNTVTASLQQIKRSSWKNESHSSLSPGYIQKETVGTSVVTIRENTHLVANMEAPRFRGCIWATRAQNSITVFQVQILTKFISAKYRVVVPHKAEQHGILRTESHLE